MQSLSCKAAWLLSLRMHGTHSHINYSYLQDILKEDELLGPKSGRELQQQVKETVVKTAAALQAAVKAGDPHILIAAHLDLTGLDTVVCDSGACLLGVATNGYMPTTVQSIRV